MLQEVASARQILVKCGNTEVNGYAFVLGVNETRGLLGDTRSENSVYCVTELIRKSIFRPDFTTEGLDTGRTSFNIGPLAELIDMYHFHDATKCHDKLYALLGMSSDDLDNAGLSPNYQTPWHEVLSRLTRFILGEKISVKTWDQEERAVIRGRGWILGKVSVGNSHGGRQHIKVMPPSHHGSRHAYKFNPGFNPALSRKPFSGCNLDLPITAASILDGDILCLLEGASKPTIIRFCGDYFAVVAIAVTTYPPRDNIEWPSYLQQRKLYSRDFLLLWDWRNSPENLNDQGGLGNYLGPAEKLPGDPKEEVAPGFKEAIRCWDASLVLCSVGEDDLSASLLGKAVKGYTAALGLRSGWVPKQYGLSQLSWASANGYEELVEWLLSRKAEVNFMEEDGTTPIFYAAKGGHLAVLQLLIASGAQVNPESPCIRDTPLSYAAGGGHEAVVQLLLAKGAKADSKDGEGRTALSHAAGGGHNAIVQLLLAEGADVDSRDEQDMTPLTHAAKGGHITATQLLLAKGATVDSSDKRARTPSSYAAGGNHEDIVRLLLAKGVDVDSKDEWGRTPLSHAAEGGHASSVHLLLAEGAKIDSEDELTKTPLVFAARGGYEAVVQLLLARGAKVDSNDDWAETPLANAAKGGHGNIVRLLLAKGANIDLKDVFGKGGTPLFHATEGGHEAVVQLLLTMGADLELKEDSWGKTPLCCASGSGHDNIVRLLLARGANFNSKDREDRTALSHAAGGGHDAVVQLLLAEGVDVNSKDEFGRTALSYAAKGGHDVVVQLLLVNGAEVDSKDRRGSTPLGHAVASGHDVVALLLRAAEQQSISKK